MRFARYTAFAASATLLGVLQARGVDVRPHPLEHGQLVAMLSDAQLHELLGRQDFVYFGTLAFLVSPTGSNQIYTSDATWNNANNKIELIGAGGGGAGSDSGDTTASNGSGGGGGYALASNFSFAAPGTTTATYRIGTGGTGGIGINTPNESGAAGGDSWFNGTTVGGATVSAHGGGFGANDVANGVVGGSGGTGVNGSTLRTGGSGGAGGAGGSGLVYTSAGGAAGPNGVGGAGSGASASNKAGGTADGGTVAGGAAGSNGHSGTEFDGTHGCGSGGGSVSVAGTNVTGPAGGLYGGGGSAASALTDANGGAGAQGIIVLTWTPLAYAFGRRRITVFTR